MGSLLLSFLFVFSGFREMTGQRWSRPLSVREERLNSLGSVSGGSVRGWSTSNRGFRTTSPSYWGSTLSPRTTPYYDYWDSPRVGWERSKSFARTRSRNSWKGWRRTTTTTSASPRNARYTQHFAGDMHVDWDNNAMNVTVINDYNSCPAARASFQDYTVVLETTYGLCRIYITFNARYKNVNQHHSWGNEYTTVYDPQIQFVDLHYLYKK
ncbi:hypothetical protein CHS0354_042296 [Potamilus streckersoni]|uniref:Uncharacterized protein n=1 Tax=Potamilus streckersoni TaxID=2493646 RepID=A0AAE0SUD5_9BIVA|nr:hypothetical protein CHS0354_042296 [Potamilus streckersoni]